jgi:DNA-binding NtrC family response regulator
VKIDVRVISATNRDLIADVRNGRFREDLFYRLDVFPIAVPALADRPEDIPELARHFVLRFAAEEGKRIRCVDDQAMALLMGHRWPGNVRQLENAVFRAVVLAEGEEIGVSEFPQVAAAAALLPQFALAPTIDTVPPMHPGSARPLSAADLPEPPAVVADRVPLPSGVLPLLDAQGEVRALDEVERAVIKFALAHYRGQMSEVARRLHIGRSTLYRKLDALGIAMPETDDWRSHGVVAG